MFCHPLKNLAVAMSLALAGHAMAAPVSLDLPSQPLATSLRQLGETAGLTIAVDDSIVAQRNAPAIKGNLEPLDALQRLLDGSGLTYQQQGSTLVISRRNDAAIELGATSIQGQGMGEATENSGSYTTGLTSVGSKTPTSLRQTPQSISIVSQQLMADQQMTDINDAMRATPGITVQNNTFRTADILSRGFTIQNFQLDGAAPMAQGSSLGSFYSSNVFDLAEFDHLEVLRGSAALFGGTGDPGGLVNMVRKRPMDAFQLKLTASAGSWDNYRQELDVTGPIAFDGKLRGRMVLANTDRQYFVDNRSTEKPFFYGVLEADVTDDTMLTFGVRYNKAHENGTQSSVPRYLDGSDLKLPRHTGLTQNWAYTDATGREVFAKIDHQLSDDWKLNISYTDLWDVGYFKSATSNGAGVNPTTGGGLTWYGTAVKQENQQRMWDTNVSGNFEMFGLQHSLVVGADYQEITSRWLGTARFAEATGAVNVFDPASTPFAEPADTTEYSRDYNPNNQKQYGVYGSVRLQLMEPLHLIVGARAQRYKFDQTYKTRVGTTWTTQSEISMREPTKVTPYGGLVYDLSDEWSVYGSYSEIHKPQVNLLEGPPPGTPMEAMEGKTYETGLKGELFGGAVNTNFALYYTKRENQGVRDPSYPTTSSLFAGSCCYVNQGEVVSKGIDLEASGEILPDWMLMAGYTYNMNRNKDSSAPLSSVTPKHLFKLFSTYRLPGVLSDLKVGGGVNLQSANYYSGTITYQGVTSDYEFDQAGYAVWNALAEYRVDDHWTVTYNANNIFDKNYYATVGSTFATNWYGEPRNHMLTLRGTFW
ncbi:ligand-gated channel protein [Pseudomonas sp. S25]|uniref:Ligand-gated channel protein n=1 Tax=Pseudomonas maioricensis TaxID=1766623 RepID=A0ABS9ZII4_9PSED|nr:TonB-dependent siderophore receptor [Pseudomonas sp. S25]MCI8209673.1 ligand-gated channel protein [Pseudomonas sp. S25]